MTQRLRERGHDVRVVTSTARSGAAQQHEWVDRVLELSPIYNSARTASASPALHEYFELLSSTVNPVNVHLLADIVSSAEPDVVYLWNLIGLGGLGILELLRRAEVPWVWHLMDCVPRLLCRFGGASAAQISGQVGLFSGGRYLACSSRLVQETEADGLELGEQVRLVPNWVVEAPPSHRTRYFGGGQLRIVSAVGTLGGHKGTDILITTAARLRERGYANFTIDLFGREPDATMRTLIHSLDLGDTVRLMGTVDQAALLPLYADYDLFAFPTWAREPSAFAPVEAAAFGCVPMFTDNCGNAEWLVDEVHCLKAPRSVQGFTDRIVQVLNGEVDLGAIARRAQRVVQSDFSLDAVVGGVESELEAAAAQLSARRSIDSDFHRLVRLAEGLLPTLLAEAYP
jgi:glycosyltransferase involved in cell wall biosynthesis